MRNLLEKYSNIVNADFYPLIIRALCNFSEKGTYIEKINFVFKNNYFTKFDNNILKYQAISKLDMDYNFEEILETVNFIKDQKKRIKVPEFEEDIRISRYFQKTADHNILIYDKIAEFIIRNKLLEICLRMIPNEIDTKQAYILFNKYYEDLISNAYSVTFKEMQIFEYLSSEISQH